MRFEVVERKEGRRKKVSGQVHEYYFVSGDRPFVFEHAVLSDFFGLDVNLRFGFLFSGLSKSRELVERIRERLEREKELEYEVIVDERERGRIREEKRGALNELIVHFLTDYKYATRVKYALSKAKCDNRVSPEDFKSVFLLLAKDFAGELVGDDWEFFKELGKVVLDIDFPQEWVKSYTKEGAYFACLKKLRVEGSHSMLSNTLREHLKGRSVRDFPSLRRLGWAFLKSTPLLEEDYKELEELLGLYRAGRVLDTFSRFFFRKDFSELVGEEGRVRYVHLEGAMPVEVHSVKALLKEIETYTYTNSGDREFVQASNYYYRVLLSAFVGATAEYNLEFFDALAVFQTGSKTGLFVPKELPDTYGEFNRKLDRLSEKFGDFIVFVDDKHLVVVGGDERLREVFFGDTFEELEEGAYMVVKKLDVVMEEGKPFLEVFAEKVSPKRRDRELVRVRVEPREFITLDRPKLPISEILRPRV